MGFPPQGVGVSKADVRSEIDAEFTERGATSARFARLDNLDAAITTRATPAQVRTEVDGEFTERGATSTRFAKLDNLSASVLSGTYTHPNVTTEEDVLEMSAANQEVEVELDLSELTQKAIIRTYAKVDGVNYRLIAAKTFPDEFDAGAKDVLISFKQKNVDYKITLQSAALEGATRSIPYRYTTRSLA